MSNKFHSTNLKVKCEFKKRLEEYKFKTNMKNSC